nr:immunoglobulin heavy chain junction region [Macaca mulatta]MOW87005.1 immunoglobulin heavy chain junction region [Macaca mulatta]MOW87440.1 immunoglobulin heavy chain junction region [Macaca mulatta]MOW87532.1 immunoglobulin heavy chain junction region [Macaca mulatta]MOW88092.1 immunoglobulin heavy chain junction region [Macaca mulatta]
CARGVLMDVW